MKISIITVCFNCLEDLKKTRNSVLAQTDAAVEHIIVDGNSRDGTKAYLEAQTEIKWVSEPDRGIYDAMNKGILMASGECLIFLNAGDFFEGDVLKFIKSAPCLIPVRFSKAGVWPVLMKQKNYKFGLPYCHQGIVFENKQIQYDLTYKVAADYDFYIRHGYRKLEFGVSSDAGNIYYDNFGFSASNSKKRDDEIARLIEVNFGKTYSLPFQTWAWAKRHIKKAINTLK